jgi:mannose-6-phosphate isomerase-like protein (cupin superfamily)
MTKLTTNTSTPTETAGYLLAKADEGQLAFGSPHVFKAAAHDTAGRFDFIVETFAPMTGPPLHFHEEQDDTFYVLEGVLTLQAGDEILDLGPGEFISIPPRMAHTFDNLHNGDDLVRAINVMTPGGLFPMIEDMARVPPGPEQPDGLMEATRRHGTHIVGPPLRVTLGLE